MPILGAKHAEYSTTQTEFRVSSERIGVCQATIPIVARRWMCKWVAKNFLDVSLVDHLDSKSSCKCKGCDRRFDDVRYVGPDHHTLQWDCNLIHITKRG